MLFKLGVKHSPVFFLAGLHFISEENEEKILKICTMNTMRVLFSLFCSSLKNSGTLEGKKNSPQKVTYVSFAAHHSVSIHMGASCFVKKKNE